MSKNQKLDYWAILCGKDYKRIQIMLIVSVILFLVMCVVIYFFDGTVIDFLHVLTIVFLIGSGVWYLYMIYVKRRVYTDEKLDLYTEDILQNAVFDSRTYIVTKNYIYHQLTPWKPVQLRSVEWVYRKRVSSGTNTADTIVMWMRNGKKQEIGRKLNFTESDVYNLVKVHNKSVMIGVSDANRKEYKERTMNNIQ
ncbi:MAG: hypothetical protein NC089_07195 [Bacteroides sp.]|nr:hypothetical protein [Bacteroides sp.]MCM1548365.1 hypothetical protein [Clostridium sp.]